MGSQVEICTMGYNVEQAWISHVIPMGIPVLLSNRK